MGDSITICKQWASAGIGEECFWEDWNGCPTPGDSLSPNDVIRDLAAARRAGWDAAMEETDRIASSMFTDAGPIAIAGRELTAGKEIAKAIRAIPNPYKEQAND